MSDDLEQLVQETLEVTGAQPPSLLSPDAPVLVDEALDEGTDFYLVGLIGGKDVGKSAMVNALAGHAVTKITSHGAGTDHVVAYVHASRAAAVTQLLDREAPGQYRIVTHNHAHLARQVLLDLPDIDSHWQSHLLLTRRMLRHMLFPIWIVSVEKYADRWIQDMLAKVAEGNSPANFQFVLNKVDQLRDDQRAINELRDDYASRIGKLLDIDPPRVWAVSAVSPHAHDLPPLRQALAKAKSEHEVVQSRDLATSQRTRSLAVWVQAQDLPQRAARMARLERDAEELLRARVGDALLERVVPAIAHDRGLRADLAERVLERRIAHWPLVNLVHTLLGPILAVATTIVRGAPSGAAAPNLEAHLRVGSGNVSDGVQAAFAQLRQTAPATVDLYAQRRLWEDLPAEIAATNLKLALETTIARQRDEAIQRLGGSSNPLAALGRWLLTIGALLWFPIIQPILSVMLDQQTGELTINWNVLARAVVDVLSAAYLLQSATFLLLYFLVLWLAIRWSTQKRVSRLLDRWASGAGAADLDLSAQVIRWMDDLLRPARQGADRLNALADRAKAISNS